MITKIKENNYFKKLGKLYYISSCCNEFARTLDTHPLLSNPHSPFDWILTTVIFFYVM